MTTEERLEKLEKELACVKRRNRWLVVGLVLCLGASVVVWALSRDTQGRYVLSGGHVLDTRTSQLWLRLGDYNVYLGTNENPTDEMIEMEEPESPDPKNSVSEGGNKATGHLRDLGPATTQDLIDHGLATTQPGDTD